MYNNIHVHKVCIRMCTIYMYIFKKIGIKQENTYTNFVYILIQNLCTRILKTEKKTVKKRTKTKEKLKETKKTKKGKKKTPRVVTAAFRGAMWLRRTGGGMQPSAKYLFHSSSVYPQSRLTPFNMLTTMPHGE